jgi:hypothetical protein
MIKEDECGDNVSVGRSVYACALPEEHDGPCDPRPRVSGTKTFQQAWSDMEAKGYRYGEDALEQVRFGWNLAYGGDDSLVETMEDLLEQALYFTGEDVTLVDGNLENWRKRVKQILSR